MKNARVALAGATGYSGLELVRLLNGHPHVKLTEKIGRDTDVGTLAGRVDLAFLATPAEVSLEMAPVLLKAGIHVVDLSGAFRLKRHAYPEWYGFEHSARALLESAEYGMYPWKPLKPATGSPRLVANPGCYATAVALALIPLVKSGVVDAASLAVDAKSGTSGAGRKAETRLLFSEIFGEYLPYKVGRHQHWPEIVETVENETSVRLNFPFVTSLIPVERGISATIFGAWKNGSKMTELAAAFEAAYGAQPDMKIGRDGTALSMKAVVGTNRVHFEIAEAFGKPIVFVSIDNLLRGAAGQALMNANQLLGFSAQEGLA